MRTILAILARVIHGPLCPFGCSHRARGIHAEAHAILDHAGDEEAR